MEDVPKHPRLQRRNGRYYCRAKVPIDLRPIIGKVEVKVSLKTSDPSVALERVKLQSIAIDEMFAEARRRRAVTPVAELTDDEIKRLVCVWLFREDAAALARFVPPSSGFDAQQVLDNLKDEEAALSSPGGVEIVHTTAANILADQNISLPPRAREWETLTVLLRRAMLEEIKRRRVRYQGDLKFRYFDEMFGDVRAAGPAPAADIASKLTLGQLINKYQTTPARAAISQKTKDGYAVVFSTLKGFLGEDKPVREITRQDCARVLDILTGLPPNASKRFPKLSPMQVVEKAAAEGLPTLHPKTVNNYLHNLSALLRWACKIGVIDKNPAEGFHIAVSKKKANKGRKPFDTAQLNAIFAAPLYTGCQNDEAGYAKPGSERPRRGRFWVPLLSLWTGMRLNECCQLLVSDIRRIDDTDVIVVQEDEDGSGSKKVKTAAGERFVPIHPELKKIGFMRYVARMGEAGGQRLFPELPKSNNGYHSDPFQKWFGRFLAKVGVKTPKTSFHSFRHTYRDALREADISVERARALGGWAGSTGEEAHYGGGFKASTLATEIVKIRYPDLDLSHLYVEPD